MDSFFVITPSDIIGLLIVVSLCVIWGAVWVCESTTKARRSIEGHFNAR